MDVKIYATETDVARPDTKSIYLFVSSDDKALKSIASDGKITVVQAGVLT